MKRELAHISIWLDDETDVSTYTHSAIDASADIKKFQIIVCPKGDVRVGAQPGDQQAIIAHELGHVLSNLFGKGKEMTDRIQNMIDRRPIGTTPQMVSKLLHELPGFGATVLPEEREAWLYAEAMIGKDNIRPELEQLAIASYETDNGTKDDFDRILKLNGLED
jgi:hypothetical protein